MQVKIELLPTELAGDMARLKLSHGDYVMEDEIGQGFYVSASGKQAYRITLPEALGEDWLGLAISDGGGEWTEEQHLAAERWLAYLGQLIDAAALPPGGRAVVVMPDLAIEGMQIAAERGDASRAAETLAKQVVTSGTKLPSGVSQNAVVAFYLEWQAAAGRKQPFAPFTSKDLDVFA